MEIKICGKCKTEKPIDQFNKKRNKIQSNCKTCTRLQCKTHYQNNKKYYFDKAKKKRDELYAFVYSLKEVPCVDCNQCYPSYVMDFDHLENKEFLMATIAGYGSKNKILKEVAKCEVVCSNCHRIRTWKRKHNISL